MRGHVHGHGHGGPGGFDGRRSRTYDFIASRLLRRVYRRLARDVATLAPERASVLDIGTGPGVLLDELARQRPDLRVTGVDPSADMVAAARRKLVRFGARAEAVTGEAEHLPFEDGSFDLVVSSLSLHHWPRPVDAASELARVVRPGGLVCVYDLAEAPFDDLVGGGRVLARSATGIGIPFKGKLTRFVLSPHGSGVLPA